QNRPEHGSAARGRHLFQTPCSYPRSRHSVLSSAAKPITQTSYCGLIPKTERIRTLDMRHKPWSYDRSREPDASARSLRAGVRGVIQTQKENCNPNLQL